MIRLYWWKATATPRSIASEIRHHGRSWIPLVRWGGRPLRNFGDALSPEVVAAALGRSVAWAAPHRAELVAIGSVAEAFLGEISDAAVWGTGLRAPLPPTVQDPERFIAVRGHLTRQALGLPSSTPVGDPGLLASLIRPSGRSRRRGTVVIPHFQDFATRSVRARLRAIRRAGWLVLPPTSHPREVVAACASADLVLASGLHGLIVADSCGVPALRVAGGMAFTQPEFKYDDYSSVVSPAPSVVDLYRHGPDAALEFREEATDRRDETAATVTNVQDRLVTALEQRFS